MIIIAMEERACLLEYKARVPRHAGEYQAFTLLGGEARSGEPGASGANAADGEVTDAPFSARTGRRQREKPPAGCRSDSNVMDDASANRRMTASARGVGRLYIDRILVRIRRIP